MIDKYAFQKKRPIGSGEPLHKISQNPMARACAQHFAPKLAELGQYGLSQDGITFAGIVPGIVLEMPKYENAALSDLLRRATALTAGTPIPGHQTYNQ